MEPTRIAVIMAGGSGERFWPLSRRARPKQLLRLTRPDRTLLEESIERIAGLIPPERIFIATSRALVEPIRRARTGVPEANVIGEPAKRNTAGALTYAAAELLARFGEETAGRITMAVLTADHRIEGLEAFREAAAAALDAAEHDGALVTLGIKPTRPETGYGYIEIEDSGSAGILPASALQAGSLRYSGVAVPVARFREKPNLATAREFVASGRFFWNSGMFFWRLDRFLGELALTSPAHAAAARAMAEALRAGDAGHVEAEFEKLKDISIDYALMEGAHGVKMVRAEFGWDDVGAWDALERAWPQDAQGNVAAGGPVLIDTRDCIVYNEPGAEKTAVAVIGVEGLVVVVSEDGVLVVPKARAQEVKRALAELKRREAKQL